MPSVSGAGPRSAAGGLVPRLACDPRESAGLGNLARLGYALALLRNRELPLPARRSRSAVQAWVRGPFPSQAEDRFEALHASQTPGDGRAVGSCAAGAAPRPASVPEALSPALSLSQMRVWMKAWPWGLDPGPPAPEPPFPRGAASCRSRGGFPVSPRSGPLFQRGCRQQGSLDGVREQ